MAVKWGVWRRKEWTSFPKHWVTLVSTVKQKVFSTCKLLAWFSAQKGLLLWPIWLQFSFRVQFIAQIEISKWANRWWCQLSPATAAIPLLHLTFPSLPLCPFPLENSYLRSVQSSPGETQPIPLKDPQGRVFPGMWAKLVKAHELHYRVPRMLEHMLVFVTHTTKSMAGKFPELNTGPACCAVGLFLIIHFAATKQYSVPCRQPLACYIRLLLHKLRHPVRGDGNKNMPESHFPSCLSVLLWRHRSST